MECGSFIAGFIVGGMVTALIISRIIVDRMNEYVLNYFRKYK